MFPLYFHYEDVSRQDPLLKPNHANVMEVPGSCKIRVVPKAAPSIKNGKLAMEIPCGQKLIQTQRASTGKSFRSNPFFRSNKEKKGYVSDLARQSTLRGHGMYSFLVRISTVMSLLDSPVEIRENSIKFSMETEFCFTTRDQISSLYQLIFYGREDPQFFIDPQDLDSILRVHLEPLEFNHPALCQVLQSLCNEGQESPFYWEVKTTQAEHFQGFLKQKHQARLDMQHRRELSTQWESLERRNAFLSEETASLREKLFILDREAP